MVRLLLCCVLLVGVLGKEILVSEDAFFKDEPSEVKDNIPYDVPEQDFETIPTSGKEAFKKFLVSLLAVIVFPYE